MTAKQITTILIDAGTPGDTINALEPVITNVVWMQTRLKDTRTEIGKASVVVPYDNGGGQTGTRENPLYKAYEALWKSYMLGMDKILKYLPAGAEIPETPAAPKSVLQEVLEKHGKS